MSTEARAKLEKGVDERLAARDKSVADYYQRNADLKATPTQREADLIKVGGMLDDMEDDGSESPDDRRRRLLEADLNNPYLTREMTPQRRRGRPSKGE